MQKANYQIFKGGHIQNLMHQSKFLIHLQCVQHAALFVDLKILSYTEVKQTIKALTNFLHKIVLNLDTRCTILDNKGDCEVESY